MPDTVSVRPADRLPWLSDPAPRAPKRASLNIVAWAGWAVAAVLLIGGGAYLLGMHSARQAQVRDVRGASRAAGPTLTLPEPQVVQPQVSIPEPPEVRPAPAPVVRLPEARADRPERRSRLAQLEREEPPRAN
ncbi:MAG TPA: hypothetical protein VFI88_02665, partial [Sphingomicrobium sp.]|nr:hypothetical protein [Sphingomicrobium sp.]